MKKTLSLILALLMTAALLAGCGGGKDGQKDDQPSQPGQSQDNNTSTPSAPAEEAGNAARKHVKVRFAQFGNNLDDADGYANDPIRAAIAEAVNIDLEYDTGTEGFDDRMETELYTGGAADLFPTWGQSDKIASYIENELVVNIGDIVNAEPDRYPTLHKISK